MPNINLQRPEIKKKRFSFFSFPDSKGKAEEGFEPVNNLFLFQVDLLYTVEKRPVNDRIRCQIVGMLYCKLSIDRACSSFFDV